ncbi:hypothetical protein HanPI659440_Chr08g0293301 [Helianthus annuus]|nr:hypothetical protein HanPI659440_Chr08g0293301 [Helianthus annuus]
MLDQVNEEIYANFQITRDMELEIVECSEFERTLVVSEPELMKTMYMHQFELKGLMAMNGNKIFSKFLCFVPCNSFRFTFVTLRCYE